MEMLIVICSIVSVLVGLPALVVSLYTLVELKAMKKSTHKVQYVPVNFNEKQDREFKESFGDDGLDSFIV